ncbi:MAG: phosphotransferase [Pseudomonadota bacterium]
MTDPRAAQKTRFLRQAGWAGAEVRPLAGDASNRRYDRLTGGPGGAGAVLMDSPPERGEDPAPFLRITELLRARGFSAPEILAADAASGFVLLEDLGDALFVRVCADRPGLEPELYAAAAELLAELQSAPPPDGALPPYDAAVLRREAGLLTDWYLPAALDAPVSDALAQDVARALDAAVAPVAQAREAVVLRDYHAENLLWLPERRGLARIGLLDYQDALAGHGAYDLISLTEDARRDVAPEVRAATETRFIEAAGWQAELFRAAAAALAAQRNLKIIGIFARLGRRDGKARYVDLIPRVWAHLQRDLSHPALSDLRATIEAHVPAPEPSALSRLRAPA